MMKKEHSGKAFFLPLSLAVLFHGGIFLSLPELLPLPPPWTPPVTEVLISFSKPEQIKSSPGETLKTNPAPPPNLPSVSETSTPGETQSSLPSQEGPMSLEAPGTPGVETGNFLGEDQADSKILPEGHYPSPPYPPLARRFGWTGVTVISFIILTDGSINELKITRSSGYRVLDQSVVETVSSQWKALPRLQIKKMNLEFQFTLEAPAAVLEGTQSRG